ncbi:ParB/RepB/Spo0J family partition protein [Arcanobacterium phocae]|uniref:ParB/RepB/Spo0J family partition protein n=1 Tax=Arcanobacterium phocae TaxID=131112 RepID=UPI001C0EDF2C|nr:ParB/RepB/Spo0J family partition protein [Arcanobacterium phocae]
MAEKRRGLGRGIGALFPTDQEETKKRPIDIFFSNPQNSVEKVDDHSGTGEIVDEKISRSHQENQTRKQVDVSRETSITVQHNSDSQAANVVKVAGVKESVKHQRENTPSKVEKHTVSADISAENDAVEQLQAIPGATFGELDLDEIVPNTQQPRQIFDEEELAELADSIREVGVLQPIVVRPLVQPISDNPIARYELIMGERRWRASRLAGNSTVPAIVRRTDTDDMLRDALLENLHRVQLNALEEAAAYQQLMEDFHYTQEELSRKIARSRPQISNTLRLLKLPPLVQRRVAAGVISAGHARALLGLSDPAAMERLAQRIVAENLSVRAVEELVSMGEDGVPEKQPRAHHTKRYQSELNSLAVRLMDRFDTKVKVVMGQKKGRISIDFGSIEDLNRILGMLNEENVDVSRETAAE